MLFSIAMALMVVLMAAFWAYQGCFSAAILFFSAVIGCAVAFGFYESVHSLWAAHLDPGIGLPLGFMLLFLIVLLGLRMLTDKMIPSNVKLPVAADRAGGAVLGLLAGLLIVGMPLIAIQMLPIGPSIFGFERVTERDGVRTEGGILLSPDGFSIKMANLMSGGSLAGSNALSQSKPDMLMSLYSYRSSVQTEDRHDLPADSMKVNAWWEVRQIDHVRQSVSGSEMSREFETQDAPPGKKLIVCNVTIDVGKAALKDKPYIYFRLPQFHVAGPPPAADGRGPDTKIYLASGVSDIYTHKAHGLTEADANQAKRLVRFSGQTDFQLASNTTISIAEKAGKTKNAAITGYRFDVAFEVPDDFVPWYIAFKRGPRVELDRGKFKENPPAYASTVFGKKGPARNAKRDNKPKVGKAVGGETHLANAVEDRTGLTNELPIPLDEDKPQVAKVASGGAIGECHAWFEIKGRPKGRVREFSIPAGKRMVQIGANPTKPGSLFGQAVNYSASVVGQTKVTTGEGQTYFAQGVYSIIPDGDNMIFELQYHPEAEVPERCLAKPIKVTANSLRSAPPDKVQFGFIFLVDPGVTITGFSSGSSKSQEMNIRVPK